jgi:hypothetical protein
MWPKRHVQRGMQADTNALRSHGRTTTELGAHLHAAAAALSGDLGATVAVAFGPVGARFAAALAEAGTELANSVTTIGDAVVDSGAATMSAASDYDDAENRARTHIVGI